MKPNVAGALAYLLGFVTGVIFFLISKDKFVRFHALQSIMLFVGLTVLNYIPFLNVIAGIVALILWLVLMFKAYKGEKFKLPVIGDIAEKNA